MYKVPFLSTSDLESMSNEHVGAACKALILTWMITADEIRENEHVGKLDDGYDALLQDQGEGRDTEFDCHLIGYNDLVSAKRHDADQFTTLSHFLTQAAGKELTTLVRYILTHVSRG